MKQTSINTQEIHAHLLLNGTTKKRADVMMDGYIDTIFTVYNDDKLTVLQENGTSNIGYAIRNRYQPTADKFDISRAISICMGRIHKQLS